MKLLLSKKLTQSKDSHFFRFLTLCTFLLIGLSNLSAQIEIGARTGYSSFTWAIANEDQYDFTEFNKSHQKGLCHSIFIATKRLPTNLQLELNYVKKGVNIEASDLLVNVGPFDTTTIHEERDLSVNYLELAFFTKHEMLDNGKISINGLTGINLGFALNGHEKSSYMRTGDGMVVNSYAIDGELDFDAAYYRKTDIGVNAGFEIAAKLSDGMAVVFDSRYQFNITNLNNNDLLEDKVRNNGFLLSLGLKKVVD